jgi:SAM-dependent methyltransferase
VIDLAEIGACPTCRGRLAPEARAFVCRSCGARWPIVRGVPRFVDSQHYVGSFGYQWRRHRKTQYVTARQTITEREFREKTGLGPEDVRGKLLLDVGVGNGRYADIALRWGARVVGVDLSLAVLSARANLAPYGDRVSIAQADLFRLPFQEQTFDAVYSIGVLHHTPSTRGAFRSVARFVKPGGPVAIGIYKYSPFLDDSGHYRRYTTAMSHSWLHFLSHAATPAYHFLRAARTVLGPLRASQLEKALFIYMHEDPAWRVCGTFDWYSPRFQWLHTESEVKGWFEELGFEDVRRMPEPTMHSVRGVLGPRGLATPPEGEEIRRNELLPPPRWVPAEPLALRDLALTVLLAGAVLRAAGEVVGTPVVALLRAAVTAVVVRAKRLLGIDREILGLRAERRRALQGASLDPPRNGH